MAEAKRASAALAISIIALALLAGTGVLLWRSMPAVEARHIAENSGDYEPPELPSVIRARSLAGARVALLAQSESRDFAAPGFYDREVGTWRRWLRALGAELVPADSADVLALPYALCLGEQTRALIARHLERGGGIIAAGALGERKQDCVPLRDTLLVSLLGGRGVVAPYPPHSGESYYALVLGETALSAGVPPGSRIELKPAEQLVFRSPTRAIFYTGYERQPQRLGGEAFFDAAVARSRVGRGCVVAFGFALSNVLPGWSERVAKNVLANAVLWAAARPILQIAPWPDGHQAAAVVAQDVEAEFANAERALDVLSEADIPATFFVVGRLAAANDAITRKLADYGEIGTHSFAHEALDTFPEPQQARRLARAKRETEELVNRTVSGLRPPEERFTLGTLRAWARTGGSYVFADNNQRAAAPELVDLGRDTLVLLARVVDDDFDVLRRSRMRDRARMSRHMLRQLQEVVAYRGLFMFSYHSHLFARPDLLPVLEALTSELRAQPSIWVAEARDVARWWRSRAALRVALAPDAGSAEIVNTAAQAVSGAVLLVDLPTGEQRRIRLPELAPGQTLRVPL